MTTVHAVLNWLYHVLGFKGSGAWYGSWSGWFADVTIIGGMCLLMGWAFVAMIVGLRKLNCHAPGCWRLGHHDAAGGLYKLCRHHHPDVPAVLHIEHIHAAHEAHLRRSAR